MPTDLARLNWALYLASRGWPVIPVNPGEKSPSFQQWENHATTDPRKIRAWWLWHPEHNIGIACGPAGLLVVDLDVVKVTDPGVKDGSLTAGAVPGAAALTRLAEQAGQRIPPTWTVRTPSGGTHLYFAQPPGAQLRNTKRRLPYTDTRGWGGQVLAPGSSTPDGVYTLLDDHDPADMPGWLVQALADRPPTATTAPNRRPVSHPDRVVAAALAGEAERIATAPPGTHNAAQMAAGRALGELVGGKHLDYSTALRVMQQAVSGHITGPCGCTERGTTAVFKSSLNYGMQRARHLDTTRRTG